jgi:DNA-binding NtrC family response regulator
MLNEPTFDQLPPDKDKGPSVLIVDDEKSARETLRMAVSSTDTGENINVLFASNLPEAMAIIEKTKLHVVLLDKNIGPDETDPEQNGLDAIPEILNLQPHVQILMVTASDDVQDAVKAIKFGAFGFITKGSEPELIICQINKAIQISRLVIDKISLDRTREKADFDDLGGKSTLIKKAVARGKAFAESNQPVLLRGETGTGKTTIAKLIHEHRQKFLKEKSRPFFGINIASLSSDLAERELFGNEKGAYTDAKEMKLGFFELANNGTLFLDEIGDVSLDLQVKLLKVIDEGKFFRLGWGKRNFFQL